MQQIREYWNTLIKEFEAEKTSLKFLADYDKTIPYLKKMENFLLDRKRINPQNIDIVCLLASIQMALRKGDDNSITLLEKFFKDNEPNLTDTDKARLYTNIAFYYDYDRETERNLLRANDLNSPYTETYKGLGLYYFSEYQTGKRRTDLKKSAFFFKKAYAISDDYVLLFSYGTALYELKEYEKAKEIFEDLLKKYPNRMRIFLALAYCETSLGNKDKALSYLKKVKIGADENYPLKTDDIGEYEFINTYYELNEYDTFLAHYENIILDYYFADWNFYFYTLWVKNKNEKFDNLTDYYISYFEEAILEAKNDDDFDSTEEKEEYIESYKQELAEFKNMVENIKNGIEKPKIELKLYPEFSCFLIDCIQHNFLK